MGRSYQSYGRKNRRARIGKEKTARKDSSFANISNKEANTMSSLQSGRYCKRKILRTLKRNINKIHTERMSWYFEMKTSSKGLSSDVDK